MTTSPGVLKDFFNIITSTVSGSSSRDLDSSIQNSELKELLTALRFIQLDRTLVAKDYNLDSNNKYLITQQMIENINKIKDDPDINALESAVTITKDKTSGLQDAQKKQMNGSYQFHYIEYDGTNGYEYVTLDVEITDGIYKLTKNTKKETTSGSTQGILSTNYKNVHNLLVNEKLKQYLNDNVYKLFSTPVKDIDSLSNVKTNKVFDYLKDTATTNPNDNVYNKSLIDIILDLEHYIKAATVTTGEKTSNKDKYKLFESIYHFMKRANDNPYKDSENKLIMDIVSFKDSIDKSKKNIKEQRNKIYTYLSRDENYTKTLQTKRIMLYLSIAASIIISVFYGGILYTNSMTNADKSTIVVVVASLILFINIILYIIRFTYQVKESFSAPSTDIIFVHPSYTTPTSFKGFTRSSQTQATIEVKTIMKEFSIEYVDLLSSGTKHEYYDALYESQKKDRDLLNKLEKEHDIKSHFHQLKNNLSHFKINETKEYSKLTQLAIVLISLIAILYLTVLQDTINIEIFNIIAGLTFIIFITYVLLTVKSIMLRDKYDWDRFNWTIKNAKSNMNTEQCPLPGFPQ